jgi:rSAM/selenodomain-associated transferase 2
MTNVIQIRPMEQVPAPGDVPSVSAIIPVLADTEALARLLEQLRASPVPPDEIVIVDGGSSAGCRSLARRYRCTYVTTRPGRGHQLHAGALRATSEVLWFLHADATPPPDAVPLIRERHAAGAAGGYFSFRFAGAPGLWKSALAQLINWRARIGVPYGDQGLFASRVAYDAVGGFADLPLFEEVPLVRGLRAQGDFRHVAADIGVSPRRWERDGWIRRTLHNRYLALAYGLGVSPAGLVRKYQPLAEPAAKQPANPRTGKPC